MKELRNKFLIKMFIAYCVYYALTLDIDGIDNYRTPEFNETLNEHVTTEQVDDSSFIYGSEKKYKLVKHEGKLMPEIYVDIYDEFLEFVHKYNLEYKLDTNRLVKIDIASWYSNDNGKTIEPVFEEFLGRYKRRYKLILICEKMNENEYKNLRYVIFHELSHALLYAEHTDQLDEYSFMKPFFDYSGEKITSHEDEVQDWDAMLEHTAKLLHEGKI